MALPDKIKKQRQRLGISQQKLGNILSLTQQAVAKWESGLAEPDSETLMKLSKLFNVTTDYLLGSAQQSSSDKLPLNCRELGDFVMYPVIGSIRAGYDGLAGEYPTGENVIVTLDMLHGRQQSDFFVLTIKGDSMYPKFLDGDNIFVLKCNTVDSGDIAAIIYNGDEATVKKVVYPTRRDQYWLDLVPINPEYKTKHIEGFELEQCKVIGKVIYLLNRKV